MAKKRLQKKRSSSTIRKQESEILQVTTSKTEPVRVETSKVEPVKVETSKVEPVKVETSCLLYTSPSPRDRTRSRMPSSA